MPVRIAATIAAMSLFSAPATLADTTGATGATGTSGASGSSPATLSVQGNGSTFVAPDVAQINVDVQQRAASSKVALSGANARADAIVAAVKALGVPASGIQTESVNVSPTVRRVGPKGHRHKVKTYLADESLSVTTTTALVGHVIDTATAKGATSVDGPNFSFSDPSAGIVTATNAALADARKRADAAATTLGYAVTGVEAVNLDPGSGTVSPAAPTAAASAPVNKSTPTTVHAGTQEVDAQVIVVYTIAPAA
jgi:hypothetical protein